MFCRFGSRLNIAKDEGKQKRIEKVPEV